ncbi:MAG: sigma 54-interacting transcriptional regulator [Planctomycetes bacterium]|nr:sigma 54-interacting transcriptional regulator [Planctomycetota bacterium]
MPSLRIMEGPGAGSETLIAKAETVIGRDKGADVILLDTMVSRVHAKILLEGQAATLVDQNSRNGTYVNRLPIDRHQLSDGDEVTIGETIFIYQDKVSRGIPKTEDVLLVAASADYQEKVTIEFPEVQKAIRLQELGRSFENLPGDQRDLAILYEVGRTINSTLDLDEILGHVLDVIFQTMPVERGMVLLAEPGSDHLRPRVMRDRETDAASGLKVSETILRYAMERGISILSTDAMSDERFTESRSVEAQVVRSMLCVPMKSRDETVGAVYVDSGKKDALGPKHLLLLSAVANQAAVAIENAKLVDQLRLENRSLRRRLTQSHLVIGGSERMKEIYDLVRRVAPTEATVLLRGESGTGKEVIARAIHQQSRRRDQPLVSVNCAALAPTLLEAEIFGYERGAFTGATERRPGRFELAHGGSLFLDEIGEIPPEIQAKLLRVLQEREFERVGGTETVRVNVRIITSTNRDLEAALEEGSFREDLYYRLKVIELHLPPLRERKEDIPALTEQFLKVFAQEKGVRTPRISSDALACLVNYDWPGNVRELKNLIERAIVLGVGDELQASHLPWEVREASESAPPPATESTSASGGGESLSLASSEKRHIEKVLQVCQWNKSKASEVLQISRPRLDRKIKEYNIQKT